MLRLTALFLALWLCGPMIAWSQGVANNYVHERTPEGGPNLVYHFIEDGGARLYWNSVTYPKQVRLMGARFHDPADVPCLDMNDRSACGKRYTPPKYRSKYKNKRKAKARRRTPKRLAQTNTKPRSQVKLGPVKPKPKAEALPAPANPEKPKLAPVPMQAADPVGYKAPEPLQ